MIQTFNGAIEAVRISAETAAGLRELGRREGVTLFMTLLAGFEILLGRYSGQEDIAVGTPIANRHMAEVEKLIGFFVNTLVMRVNIGGDPTVRELLKRVREMSLGAYGHQDLPFEKLVEELQPERDLGRNPLVQVVFALQNAPDEGVEMKGIQLQSLGGGAQEATRFDLEFYAQEQGKGLGGWIKYNTDLYESGTIRRMAGHLERLLGEMVGKPEGRLSELEILGGEERRQLLEGWNDTQREYPRNRCIHELIEEQAERTPGAVAVVCGEKQLSYQELNRRSNQLAHYLRGLGVGPEVLVGICVERSLEMVVGLLGILKAGGAYVPLDPDYPKERLAFMLEDARVAVILTQRELAEKLGKYGACVVCLDEEWQSIEQSDGTNPAHIVRAANLAYVLFTSGSTGRPKGSAISHGAIANHMLWMQRVYPISEADCVFQKTPFSFDASVWEFYAPLLVGGQLIMARPGGHRDIYYLIQTIQSGKVSILQAVPSLVSLLVQEPQFGNCQSLRRVFCGGEPLSWELQERFLQRLPTSSLHNLYGPTEVTIDSVHWTCRSEDRQRSLPIGRPIDNIKAYVLDDKLAPVPIGVTGELCLSGAGLSRGYIGRPELTAEKFIPDPYSPEGGRRMYRTGDLGRYLAEGNLEFLGRADHQVKIRGFRIELGEIESVLGGHPQVREAVVVAREDQPGDRRLVGYVVPREAGSATGDGLREFLKERLPEHMVPSFFVVMDALPLSANGKVDRQALPAPEGRQTEARYEAPQSQAEKLIAGVWQELLKVDQVGVEDNFFDIGGHSLLLVRVHGRLEQVLQRKLALVELFQYPTIRRLAEHLMGGEEPFLKQIRERAQQSMAKDAVAVIGMAGRFPGRGIWRSFGAIWKGVWSRFPFSARRS